MKKINEIKNVLNFYVKTHKFKNKIIDEANDYSIADHLFGSMILATAIDSEFEQTTDLSKIYRMLFFSEFNHLYPTYNFENLKLGKKCSSEILESSNMNTEDSKLVFKYKTLDFLLTQLIKEKEVNISMSKLMKEGCAVIAHLFNKQPSECEEIFKFYHLNLSLKDKMRTGWDSNHWNVKSNRLETISEHVIGTFSLALVANCEFEYPFDFDKILKMVLIHEIGETLIGDITSFDGIMQEKKKEIEQQAMKRALGNLRQKDNLLALLYEFDERKTKEATFSYYCDKMEADLEAKLAHEKGLFVSLENRKDNRVLNNPKIQRMIKDGLKNVIDIFFQWDRPIYETSDDMQEFSEMLKISRNDRLSQENVETEG